MPRVNYLIMTSLCFLYQIEDRDNKQPGINYARDSFVILYIPFGSPDIVIKKLFTDRFAPTFDRYTLAMNSSAPPAAAEYGGGKRHLSQLGLLLLIP